MKHFTPLLLLLLLCGCANTDTKTGLDAGATVTHVEPHPSFRLDASAKRKLVEKAIALKVGDSLPTVTNALGKPTYDQTLSTKESPGRFIARSLKYYAVIWEDGLVNELYDELVVVELDDKDCVRYMSIKVTLE